MKNPYSLLSLAGIGSSLLFQSSFAANITWSGASNNDFNNGLNWVGGVVPGTADRAYFSGGPSTANLSAPVTVLRLQANAATVSVNASAVAPLTLSSSIAISSRNGGLFGSDMDLSGTFIFTSNTPLITVLDPSTVDFSGAELLGNSGATLTLGGGGVVSLDASTISSSFLQVDVEGSSLAIIGGGNEVNTTLSLDNSSLTFSGAADTLEVSSLLATGAGGSWVFDLATTDSDAYIVAGSLDITNIDLDLSNLSPSVNSNNPVILASYAPGQLTGSAFSSLSGLGPNQFIDYNFKGLNQIAIVPEPGITIPILAGFLPLFGFRRRLRR